MLFDPVLVGGGESTAFIEDRDFNRQLFEVLRRIPVKLLCTLVQVLASIGASVVLISIGSVCFQAIAPSVCSDLYLNERTASIVVIVIGCILCVCVILFQPPLQLVQRAQRAVSINHSHRPRGAGAANNTGSSSSVTNGNLLRRSLLPADAKPRHVDV